jgi:hypothetical protein
MLPAEDIKNHVCNLPDPPPRVGSNEILGGGDNTTNGGVYLTVYNDFQQSVIVNLDVAVSSSAAAAASSSAAAAKSSAAKTSSAPIQLVTVGGM